MECYTKVTIVRYWQVIVLAANKRKTEFKLRTSLLKITLAKNISNFEHQFTFPHGKLNYSKGSITRKKCR